MNQEYLMKVLVSPLMSEKATRAAEKFRQIVFKVLPDATKLDVKAAVEKLFDVKVKGVTMSHSKGKRRVYHQIPGKRSGFKKAYVSLEKGYDISFATGE